MRMGGERHSNFRACHDHGVGAIGRLAYDRGGRSRKGRKKELADT